MKKIKIAEPCHENWNDFTSTQRGAFCGKCQINVIDFSKKSNSEIKNILDDNKGKKMCGRFLKVQLDNFNYDYEVWQNQSQPIFQSKFIFALVLGFGLALFSCSNPNGKQAITEIKNNVVQLDTVIEVSSVDTTVIQVDSLDNSIIPEIPTPPVPVTTCNIDYDIMGDIEISYPEPDDEILGELAVDEDYLKGKVAVDNVKHSIKPEEMILGKMAVDVEIIKPIIKEFDYDKVTLTDKFEAKVFPNPTNNKSTLNIHVLAEENYNIGVFNSKGDFIMEVYKGKIKAKEAIFKIDLKDQSSGLYFVRIITDTQNSALKLIKN